MNGNGRAGWTGALTIDVEDYFHVHAFADAIDRSDWDSMESRVEANTNRLLDLFAAREAKATFFTLGCVGAQCPALIRRIVAEGHELASHGWAHYAVHQQTRDAFFEDVRRARQVLEDIGGVPVIGYRAPSFSIDPRSPWAYEALAGAGYRYSSSSHPIAHDHYGDAEANRHPHHEPSAGILEIPITTLERFGRRYPGGGGGFFRVFPLAHFRSTMRRMADEGIPPNFYLHPWEIDPGQPRIKAAPLKSRLRHYVGLSRCEAKLSALLQGAHWTRMDSAYDGWLDLSDRPDPRTGERLSA